MVAFSLNTILDNGKEWNFEGYLERGINVLFGASGSGKTFLIRHLIGLSKGIKMQDGDPIDTPLYKSRSIAYLPQGGGILPRLSIEQNIFLGMKPDKKAIEKVDEIKDRLDLKFYNDDPSDSLSGGERLKLSLLRCLNQEAEFYILDEPFSGLDPYSRHVCRELLEEIPNQDGKYILFSTHDLEDANIEGANLLLIDEGRITKMESLTQIRDHFFNPGS